MSQASVELVREFFIINDFFVLKKEDLLLVKNAQPRQVTAGGKFILQAGGIKGAVNNAVVKPLSWHTMKFTPLVLSRFPDIFEFLKDKNTEGYRKFFGGEDFLKILVIPSLPASENLRDESIRIMQEKGIDRLVMFSSVIAGLVDRIEARHVYLSTVNEVLRVLKFYKFFAEEEQNLPF
jgi:hypothetical protein